MKAIITGMHRSGTSATMGVLELCGLYIGDNFTRPRKANAKGYFEDREFRRVNQFIIARRQDGEARREIKRFLREWKGKGPVGWKDPYASLTIETWARHVKGLKVVVCERPHVEIAESLKARQGMMIVRGMALTSVYVGGLNSSLFSGNISAYRIRYHDLVTDWRNHLPGLCDFLELDGPGDEARIDDFIDQDLWHQRQGVKENGV